MIVVTMHDTATKQTLAAEIPSTDYLVVSCTWTQAEKVIAERIMNENKSMTRNEAYLLADLAIQALASSKGILLNG